LESGEENQQNAGPAMVVLGEMRDYLPEEEYGSARLLPSDNPLSQDLGPYPDQKSPTAGGYRDLPANGRPASIHI
jgi:hypothetical protein